MLTEPLVRCLAAALKKSLMLAMRGSDTCEASRKAAEVAQITCIFVPYVPAQRLWSFVKYLF